MYDRQTFSCCALNVLLSVYAVAKMALHFLQFRKHWKRSVFVGDLYIYRQVYINIYICIIYMRSDSFNPFRYFPQFKKKTHIVALSIFRLKEVRFYKKCEREKPIQSDKRCRCRRQRRRKHIHIDVSWKKNFAYENP